MHAPADVASHFRRLAGDVLTHWHIQKRLSECARDGTAFTSPRVGLFFARVNNLLIDFLFLSVARLHDPASSSGQSNVSANYIVEQIEDGETKGKLTKLLADMALFVQKHKQARNKLLAHNDAASILDSAGNIGGFESGDDEVYMMNLRCFATIISEHYFNEPFLYADLAANDVDAVQSILARGLDTFGD